MFSITVASVLLVTPLLSSALHLHPQPSHRDAFAEKRAGLLPLPTNAYTLKDVYEGDNFLTDFTFEADADPTHGRVNYVNESYAVEKGLASVKGNTFTMRADYTTVLDPNGPGRDSVRIKSVKQYTTHLAVYDNPHLRKITG